jgi:hypothetical protein
MQVAVKEDISEFEKDFVDVDEDNEDDEGAKE